MQADSLPSEPSGKPTTGQLIKRRAVGARNYNFIQKDSKLRRWWTDATATAKSLQSCPTLCDPIDISPPGSPALGILQARTLNGLPFPSPMHEREKVKVKSLSRVRLLATPWTAAYQAPPPMGFSRQEYWTSAPK